MIELSIDEKDRLKRINNDPYSKGAFSGMVYNSLVEQSDWSEDKIIQHIRLALQIRLVIEELIK